MDILQLMKERHSVRSFELKSIEDEKKDIITNYVNNLNNKYHTHHQIFFDDPDAFKNSSASYGNFSGCNNYIMLVSTNDKDAGYSGELIALKLQSLGLNTCFVGLTYKRGAIKKKVNLNTNEKIRCLLAIGYGINQGKVRKTKTKEQLIELKGNTSINTDELYLACSLAPTAINQQKFKIIINGDNIEIIKKGLGPYLDFDLGIINAHKDLILKHIELE